MRKPSIPDFAYLRTNSAANVREGLGSGEWEGWAVEGRKA